MIGWRQPAIALAVLGMVAAAPAVSAEDAGPAGFYHITPAGIGSGYQAYFALYEDGTWRAGDQFVCIEDGLPNRETVLSRSGTWLSQSGRLVLTEAERSVVRGGTCRCDAVACAIADGTQTVEHPNRAIAIDPRATCASHHDPVAMIGHPLPCLTIEGTGYFRLGRAEDLLP